jgi:hypothetical protein
MAVAWVTPSIVIGSAVSPSQIIAMTPGQVVQGEALSLSIEWDGINQATITGDPAWTLVQKRDTIPGQDMSSADYVKIASAADAAGTSSYTFTFSISVNHQALIDRYSGADPAVPIDLTNKSQNAAIPNPAVAPSVTVVRTGSWVALRYSAYGSGGTWSTPAGYTPRAAGGHTACFDSAGPIAPGASGAQTSTYTIAPGEWTARQLVIQPPAPVAPSSGRPQDHPRRPRHHRPWLYVTG